MMTDQRVIADRGDALVVRTIETLGRNGDVERGQRRVIRACSGR